MRFLIGLLYSVTLITKYSVNAQTPCLIENEVYTECDATPCQNTCEDPNYAATCSDPPICYPGCICASGYLRNASGACVPRGPCLCTRKNEEFQECGTSCPKTCENKDQQIDCIQACVEGCFCQSGFVRDAQGECILPADCPKINTCTGANEVYSECGNNSCVRNCDTYFLTDIACKPICTPGCICEEGYTRNSQGVCVKPSECACTRKNEEYQECGTACPKTCENKDKNLPCTFQCVEGCFCQSGFVRDALGECILPADCPKNATCTGENEVYSECGNNSCVRNCDTYFLTDIACKPICTPGCICEEGYTRNSQGVCVKPSECDNVECPTNEEFTQCVCPCCENCATLGQDVTCNFLVCNPGCDCKKGFFRNGNGTCVAPEECVCDANETYKACAVTCPPRTCSAIGKAFKCAAPDPNNCRPSCSCNFNYRRDSDGVCIPIQDCPPLECTNQNEVYDSCPYQCLDERCESLYEKPLPCPKIRRECRPQCVCQEGYLRNKDGVCIAKDTCEIPCKCQPNETYNTCPYSCPPEATCESYLSGIIVDCAPPPEDRECIPKCECSPGFVRKVAGGPCIKQETCCEDPNAEVVSCPNPCGGGTCENPEYFKNCKAMCKVRGCQCKPGYVLNANGKCILLSECPKKQCKKNEVLNPCPYPCPPEETCDIYLSGLIIDCARPPEDRLCIPRCDCKPGFVRKTSGGDCIKQETCCEDPNAEVVSCPNPCPGGTCEAPKFADCKAPCKVIGCQCKSGYVKDTNGKCILLSKCPNQCRKNEIYKTCGTACPATCANKFPTCTEQCVPGCFCDDGFIQSRVKGVCIPEDACPKPKCSGQNEVYNECGTACPRTCENKDDDSIICTKQCVQGCFCMTGFVRKNGVCVLPDECGCGPYEVFSDNAPTVQETCATLGKQPRCKKAPGCVCAKGYVRSSNKGKCIKVKECKKMKKMAAAKKLLKEMEYYMWF